MSAVEEIRSLGRRARALRANFEIIDEAVGLANQAEAVGLANQAIDFLGGIDCLVNNPGITMNKPFLKVTREQI